MLTYYDDRGWKKTSTDPDMGQWLFEYYPLGELKKQTDAKGQIVTFAYDRLSRLTSRADPEGGSAWDWGDSAAARNIGQLEQLNSPGWQENHTYDSAAGRLLTTTTTIDGVGYTFTHGYNATTGFLETLQYPASYGTPLKLKYEYETANKSGLLKKVSDFNAPSTVFWEATSTNAFSQYNLFAQGGTAGAQTENEFDTITGAINHIETLDGAAVVQNLDYRWNKARNVTQRTDVRQSSLTETFAYDHLHRLTGATINSTTKAVGYDSFGLGNIASKTDIGTYSYTATVSGCNYYAHTQPHAVRQITGATSQDFCYDQNGNMTKRNGATISWYSYNLPQTINQTDGMHATFSYDANRQRYKQIAVAYPVPNTVTRTTTYVQELFEGNRDVWSGGDVTWYRHQIVADGRAVAVHYRDATLSDTYYLNADHLGSLESFAGTNGAAFARFSDDAWGQRRDSDWVGPPSPVDMDFAWSITNRGFTGHEHLDNLGLIHMNGRVYDPGIGRFISADPLVSFPFHTQSLNRYSYVLNNPLSLTDPSGFTPRGGLPTDFEGLDRCNGEACGAFDRSWRAGYGMYWGWSAWMPRWVRDQLKREYILMLDDWRAMQMSRIRRGMPPGTYDPLSAEELARSNRRELVQDIARGVYEEFIGKPIDAVVDTAKAVQAGDYAAAAVGAADVACNAFKPCKLAEKGLEKLGGKAGDKLKSVAGKADKKCCFVAGTLVATEDGLVPIEQIEVSDLVWSRDATTQESALKPVTELVRRHEREIWELTLAVDGDAPVFFETTDDHPWRTIEGAWATTMELVPGMQILRAAGTPATVISVELTERTESTYNLVVADFHTYFVGEAGAWVHNCDISGGPKAGSSGGPGTGKRFSESTKNAAESQAGGRCVFCGKETTRTPGPNQRNTDHADPKSRGGNNTLDSAQNTCRTCNQDKGTKTTKEHLQGGT